MKLILPKNRVEIPESSKLIFLAGPVGGAPRWHNEAIRIIDRDAPEIYIACPVSVGLCKLDWRYIGEAIKEGKEDFKRQLDWEEHYLNLASEKGAIMFWLPAQVEAMPLTDNGFPRAYARDTREESGGYTWGPASAGKQNRFVLGYEEGFDGIDVIQRNILKRIPNQVFYHNLEETCQAAIEKAK